MRKFNETFIRIDRTKSLGEDWYRGRIEHKEEIYEFWIIKTYGSFYGDDDPFRIEWMRKDVPSEVKTMENRIIEQFEIEHRD